MLPVINHKETCSVVVLFIGEQLPYSSVLRIYLCVGFSYLNLTDYNYNCDLQLLVMLKS